MHCECTVNWLYDRQTEEFWTNLVTLRLEQDKNAAMLDGFMISAAKFFGKEG